MLNSTVETIRIRMIVFAIILLILTVLWAVGLVQVGGGPVMVH